MLWILFVTIAAIAYAIKALIHRHVMKSEDPFAYALMENVFGSIAFLPLLIMEFQLPHSAFAWALIFISGALWTAIAIVGYHAYKHTHVSLKEPLSQTSILVAGLLAVLLLNERYTSLKIIGTILIFIGIITLTYKKDTRFGSFRDKGVQFTLIAACMTGFANITDKTASTFFTAGTLGFLLYLVPGLFVFAVTPKKRLFPATKKLIKNKWRYLLVIGALSPFVYYSILRAYQLADVSTVQPFLKIYIILTLIAGMIIFKEERVRILQKLAGTVVVIAGAIALIL